MTGMGLKAALEIIRGTADRMAQDLRFKVTFDEFPAMTADDISAWEDEIAEAMPVKNFKIPKALDFFYRETGGYQFQWQYLDTNEIVTGSSCIVTLMEIYQRDEELDKPMEYCLSNQRAFDIISPDDETVIEFEGDYFSDFKISLLEKDKDLKHPLHMGIERYIENVAEFRAIYRWQDAFIGSDTKSAEKVLRERLKTYLSSV